MTTSMEILTPQWVCTRVSAALVVSWTVLDDETVMVVEGGATPIFSFHVDTTHTLHAIFITAEKPACVRETLGCGKHRSSCLVCLAPMGRRTSFNTEVNEARRPILQRACNTTKLKGSPCTICILLNSSTKDLIQHQAIVVHAVRCTGWKATFTVVSNFLGCSDHLPGKGVFCPFPGLQQHVAKLIGERWEAADSRCFDPKSIETFQIDTFAHA